MLKRMIKRIGAVGTLLMLLYIGYLLYRENIDLTIVPWQVILLLVVLQAMVMSTFALQLKYNLAFFSGRQIILSQVYGVFAKSNIAKYIPGNIFQYVSRGVFAKQIGIDAKKSTVSTVFEIGMLAGTALLIAFVFSFGLVLQYLGHWLFILVGAGVLVALVLIRLYGMGLLGLGLRMLPIMLLMHVANGLMFLYILHYTSGLDMDFAHVSAYVFAWLVGFITPGSPGGVGVKEATLIVLISVEGIVLASVMYRVVTILADVLCFVLSLLIDKRGSRPWKNQRTTKNTQKKQVSERS